VKRGYCLGGRTEGQWELGKKISQEGTVIGMAGGLHKGGKRGLGTSKTEESLAGGLTLTVRWGERWKGGERGGCDNDFLRFQEKRV